MISLSCGGQLVKPLSDVTAVGEQLRQADVGRVMPRFAFKQAGIESGQLGLAILDMSRPAN